MWIVPGAPLEKGRGWRLWCADESPGGSSGPLNPPNLQVLRGGAPADLNATWQLLPLPSSLAPRAGVLTLTLQNPEPGADYDVFFPDLGRTFPWRSLPERIDAEGVVFLLSSCFWRDDDKNGTYAAAVRFLQKKYRPCFKFLTGDQVYLDYPVRFSPFAGPAEVTDERYREYFDDGNNREVLAASPNFIMCDDHEYWNDYPEGQPHLQRTRPRVRQAYGEMADKYYDFFQHSLNPQKPWQGPPAVHPLGITPATERWYSFRVDPVSFFIADTRTGRQEAKPGAKFFQEAQWQALEAWQQSLTGPGVLVLGQPLFQSLGNWKDHALLNFPEDYGRLCALIEDSHLGKNATQTPHQILMLSGDIHTGRHAVRTIHGPGFANERLREVHEFISSPASCILSPFSGSRRDPELAPDVIRASHGGRSILWSRPVNSQIRATEWTTLDNHVGFIHMTPGNDGRTRFSLWHFRIRLGPGAESGRDNQGPLQWIAGTEIELS